MPSEFAREGSSTDLATLLFSQVGRAVERPKEGAIPESRHQGTVDEQVIGIFGQGAMGALIQVQPVPGVQSVT
jgi:hypothetical protein